MQITLDSSLKPTSPGTGTKQRFIDRHCGATYAYRMKERVRGLICVAEDLPGEICHDNYLNYLEIAWSSHHGVVMTPDILWHALLCEAVAIVAEDPPRYASLFTETPDRKQTIIIVAGEEVVMPLGRLVDALRPLIPTDPGVFLPEFSTTTDRSRMARYAAFADMVSPYYNYMMLACGIPHVDVRGTSEDYAKVADSWRSIGSLMAGHEAYFARTQATLDRLILDRSPGFWREMFRAVYCGSGHQVEVCGWWTELYRRPPNGPRYAENFASHLACVKYRQLDFAKNYEMLHGVVTSRMEGGCLVPEFGSIVMERPAQPVRTPDERHACPVQNKDERQTYVTAT